MSVQILPKNTIPKRSRDAFRLNKPRGKKKKKIQLGLQNFEKVKSS